MALTKNKILQSISTFPKITIKSFAEKEAAYKINIYVTGSSQIDDVIVFLNYDILVTIPYSYPKLLPVCYEYGEKKIRWYSHINPDKYGTFCLGTAMEIRQRLYPRYDIGKYFELVVEYLTVYSYYSRYHVMPVVERSHGEAGILEGYQDMFELSSSSAILHLLKSVPVSNKNKNMLCPCGSKKKLKNCHFNQLISIFKTGILRKQVQDDLVILNNFRRDT